MPWVRSANLFGGATSHGAPGGYAFVVLVASAAGGAEIYRAYQGRRSVGVALGASVVNGLVCLVNLADVAVASDRSFGAVGAGLGLLFLGFGALLAFGAGIVELVSQSSRGPTRPTG